MKFYGLIAAMAFVALPLHFGAASAAGKDAMAMPSMDCATANATLMKMMSPAMMKPMPMNGSATLDTNFSAQMRMMSEHGMQMAKLEAKCGKDAKTRATARKMAEDLQGYVTRFETPPAI